MACATTLAPEMVPWSQHAIGCQVRVDALREHVLTRANAVIAVGPGDVTGRPE